MRKSQDTSSDSTTRMRAGAPGLGLNRHAMTRNSAPSKTNPPEMTKTKKSRASHTSSPRPISETPGTTSAGVGSETREPRAEEKRDLRFMRAVIGSVYFIIRASARTL